MRDMSELRSMIKKHEGMRLKPYKCTSGKLSIGFGRNIEDNGISLSEAEHLLNNDILACEKFLAIYDWFNRLNDPRKDVLVSMVYNLGATEFLKFKRFIVAIYSNEYELAAKEMIASKWASQVKGRAHELAEIMKTGEYSKEA